MGRVGLLELGVILAIVLIFAGPTQLPKLLNTFKNMKKSATGEKKVDGEQS